MDVNQILSAIDQQILKLQQARAIFAGPDTSLTAKRGPARPKRMAAPLQSVVKRTMSAEGEARIAAAQKKRWAAARKGTS